MRRFGFNPILFTLRARWRCRKAGGAPKVAYRWRTGQGCYSRSLGAHVIFTLRDDWAARRRRREAQAI